MLFLVFVLCFFSFSQARAASSQVQITLAMNQMIEDLTKSNFGSDEIMQRAVITVQKAISEGATEKDFMAELSRRLSSVLSAQEFKNAIDEIKNDHSPEKIHSMATELQKTNDSQGFIAVLIMFAIYSLILYGVFLLLAKKFPDPALAE
jgi:hypothetical protein